MRTRALTPEEERATKTLVHYFKTSWERAGLQWKSDNTTEVEGIVTDIVDAAVNLGGSRFSL